MLSVDVKLVLMPVILVAWFVGCSKQEPYRIDGFENFSPEQKEAVVSVFSKLNEDAGRTLVSESGDGYRISIHLADELNNASEQGHAEMSLSGCTITLLRSLRLSLLKAVAIHELGHCLGLPHVQPTYGAVMSPQTGPIEVYYSGSSYQEFIESLLQTPRLH
ncbi:MAG: hypothetical protein HY537_03290 [Deltaproteobacteria bacterium]|nr:hypothetical protein [Deltaproteobacteria bacterium]